MFMFGTFVSGTRVFYTKNEVSDAKGKRYTLQQRVVALFHVCATLTIDNRTLTAVVVCTKHHIGQCKHIEQKTLVASKQEYFSSTECAI